MSTGDWVLLFLAFVALCWAVGVYLEIANYEIDEARAMADMEAMLKAGRSNDTPRPRVRAGTESLTTKGVPDGH